MEHVIWVTIFTILGSATLGFVMSLWFDREDFKVL